MILKQTFEIFQNTQLSDHDEVDFLPETLFLPIFWIFMLFLASKEFTRFKKEFTHCVTTNRKKKKTHLKMWNPSQLLPTNKIAVSNRFSLQRQLWWVPPYLNLYHVMHKQDLFYNPPVSIDVDRGGYSEVAVYESILHHAPLWWEKYRPPIKRNRKKEKYFQLEFPSFCSFDDFLFCEKS